MDYFTTNQWLIVGLVFLLGLVLGAALRGSGRWKGRYAAENARVRELEAENARLRKEADEMGSLRSAAARDEARRRADEPGPV
jgi:hypothetical protein